LFLRSFGADLLVISVEQQKVRAAMRRFTELLGFYGLGGFVSFADAGFLWGSSWRLGVDSLEGTA
jgi:chromosome condensin MukBEF MukE localization factor